MRQFRRYNRPGPIRREDNERTKDHEMEKVSTHEKAYNDVVESHVSSEPYIRTALASGGIGFVITLILIVLVCFNVEFWDYKNGQGFLPVHCGKTVLFIILFGTSLPVHILVFVGVNKVRSCYLIPFIVFHAVLVYVKIIGVLIIIAFSHRIQFNQDKEGTEVAVQGSSLIKVTGNIHANVFLFFLCYFIAILIQLLMIYAVFGCYDFIKRKELLNLEQEILKNLCGLEPFNDNARKFRICAIHSRRAAKFAAVASVAFCSIIILPVVLLYDWHQFPDIKQIFAFVSVLLMLFITAVLIPALVVLGINQDHSGLLLPFISVHAVLIIIEAGFAVYEGYTEYRSNRDFTAVFVLLLFIMLHSMLIYVVYKCYIYLKQKHFHGWEVHFASKQNSNAPQPITESNVETGTAKAPVPINWRYAPLVESEQESDEPKDTKKTTQSAEVKAEDGAKEIPNLILSHAYQAPFIVQQQLSELQSEESGKKHMTADSSELRPHEHLLLASEPPSLQAPATIEWDHSLSESDKMDVVGEAADEEVVPDEETLAAEDGVGRSSSF